MNDIKQFRSILKQGISRNTDVLLGCEFLEKLLNMINDYENTKNQLQQKENIIKEVREYIEKEREKMKNHQYAVGIRRLNKINKIIRSDEE